MTPLRELVEAEVERFRRDSLKACPLDSELLEQAADRLASILAESDGPDHPVMAGESRMGVSSQQPDSKHKSEQQGARDGLSEGVEASSSAPCEGGAPGSPLAESVQKGEQPRACPTCGSDDPAGS